MQRNSAGAGNSQHSSVEVAGRGPIRKLVSRVANRFPRIKRAAVRAILYVRMLRRGSWSLSASLPSHLAPVAGAPDNLDAWRQIGAELWQTDRRFGGSKTVLLGPPGENCKLEDRATQERAWMKSETRRMVAENVRLRT
jgi:hypothetical protein